MTLDTFKSNITRLYGQKGKVWLEELPALVEKISSKLSLHALQPMPDLSYNYVLSGLQADTPIILKLGYDNEALAKEALTLQCFAKWGGVNMMTEISTAYDGYLLLSRLVPGTSLKSYFPDKEAETVKIICAVIEKLHMAKIPKHHNFPHINNWLSILDKKLPLPFRYLQKARKLRDRLLQNAGPDILLHGDLHHYNILQNGETWVAIDPKGVIGETAYEVAAFIRNPIPDLLIQQNATEIIQNRITTFSNILNISTTRIAYWCFVQTILAWAWALEDGCDTEYWKQMAKILEVTST